MVKVVSVKKVKAPSVLYKAPNHGELELDGHKFQVSELDKIKTKGGLHDVFICPPGWCWMVADYAAEEMRIMANFSGEPNFINPILNGKDIHTYIAEQMFGYSNPDHRKKVKVLNFALSYGANEYTISQRLGIPVDESKSLIDHYFKTLSRFSKWRQEQCKIGRRKGIIYTLFGRPRLVYKYYNSSDRSLQAFGDRTCMNSPVQGCVPLAGYIELKDSVAPLKSLIGRREETVSGLAVFQHRGEGDIVQCIGDTGDFIFCDSNHKLVTGSLEDPRVTSIRDSFTFNGNRVPCLLAPLRKKRIPSKGIFKLTPNAAITIITGFIKRGEIIKSDVDVLNDSFWRLWWSSKWFKLKYEAALSIRSVASLYGFNVVYSLKKDAYKVTYRRHDSTRILHFKYVSEKPKLVPVGTCTMMQGYAMYQSQGFWNKNTGGDILRLDFIKLMKLFDTDPEWSQNVMFQFVVHDEIDCIVKQEYLKTAVKKLEELMFFQAPGMAVPIVAEPGVGKDWGSVIDLKEGFTIDDMGKLHSKKYDP